MQCFCLQIIDMVSDAILGAGIGVFGTLLGSGLTSYWNYKTESKRLVEERQRIQAEIHSERQLQYLMELYDELPSLRETLITLSSLLEQNLSLLDDDSIKEDMQEVGDFITKFTDLFLRCKIFLEDETEDVINTVLKSANYVLFECMKQYSDAVDMDLKSDPESEYLFNSVQELQGDYEGSDPEETLDSAREKVNKIDQRLSEKVNRPIQFVSHE